MKLAINLSPSIAAVVQAQAEEIGCSTSAVIRKALASHFNLDDDFKPATRWQPNPYELQDAIPEGANI